MNVPITFVSTSLGETLINKRFGGVMYHNFVCIWGIY